ncbi:polymorphic toxin-type HINT domain-containing protein [Amycolatopsis sp. TRM77291]
MSADTFYPGNVDSVNPSDLAPRQEWGTAEGQQHEVESATGNRAEPKSELAKYPQPVFHSDKPKPNPVAEQAVSAKVTGFDERTSRELPDRRGPRERTFANPDGTETTEFSEGPLNFRRPDGGWQPIDPAVVPDGGGWRNAADQVDTRFAGTASAEPFVSMRLPGAQEFAFGLAGAQSVPARVEGSSITYPGVAGGADLRIDVLPGGIKETLVLGSPRAATSWLFPLRLGGLTPKLVDGRVALLDGSGTEQAHIPAGFMTDSTAENPATSYDVTYSLVPHGGGQALKVDLDQAWLRDPARHYPVLVDPSVHQGVAGNSMYVSGGQRRGGASELLVGNGSVGYFDFGGVSGALSGHKIFSAQLYLTNFDAPSCRPEPITVHPVTAPWGTSGTPPTGGVLGGASFAHGYVGLGQSYSPCPTAAHAIDLGDGGRDLVQGWVKGQPNHGLAVKAVRGWKKFTGHQTANKPRLFVTHTPYDAGYRIERGVPEPPVHRDSGDKAKVRIAVTNRGSRTWTPAEYRLSYRAFTADGRPKDARESAKLPRDVPPGDTVTLDATVFGMEPGDYLLDFSMVHNNTFFTDEQIPPARLSMTVFELPPVVKAQYPPAGHTAPTLTPQLWADAVDIDAPPNTTIDYEFEICQRNEATGAIDFGCTLSPRTKAKTWTVPKGRLRWSETYHWRAFAVDPSGTRSEQLPFSALLTAVPQPDITSHLGGAPYSAGDLDFDPQIGNYTTGAIDAAVGVTGPDLNVARTYNSLDPRKDLAFGAGWSTRYDMRVVPDLDGSGNVVVTYPDGQQVRFGHNAENGSFAPPPGRFATFYQDVVTPAQNYVLVDKSNTTYTFRPFDGKLITVHDNAGRWVEFDYGSTGQLKRAISRTSGRTLYFTWTGAHVTEVKTDPVNGAAISWKYEYDGDRLTRVCDPKNGCTSYEYDTGSHYRSAVIDAKPDSYWRLGETEGDVAKSQVATNLGKDGGAYRTVQLGSPGMATGSPDTAATFNGTNSYVKLPDGAIKKSRDLSIEMWFKTTSGGPLVGFQHQPFDRAPGGAVPALYVDRDGKLRGQFWHGRVAPITTTGAVNDGQWHHVVLSGSLATQTMFLDGVKVGTTDGEIDDSLLTYGQIGASHVVGPANWEAAGWWPGQAVKHFAGEIDEVALYQHPLGESAAKAHFAARAAADQLTKVTMPGGRVAAQLTYDTVNDRIRTYTDDDGGKWTLGIPQVSGTEKLDEQKRPVRNLVRSIEVTDPANRSRFYDYDPIRGRVIRTSSPLGLGTRDEDRPDPSVVPSSPPTSAPACTGTPPPNPDGSPVYCGGKGHNTPDWVGGPVQGIGVRSYDYDESGFQQTITDENGHQVVLQNDERGNVVSRRTCREPGVCDTEYFTYYKPAPGKANDTDPRIDKQLESRDGRSTSATDNTYRTTFAYTPRGDLDSQVTPDGSTVKHFYTDGESAAVGGGLEPAGLLQRTSDARGAETRNRYYANGDLAETEGPRRDGESQGMVTRYTYDALGRKVTETEVSDAHPQGLTTTFTYDERNLLAKVTEPPVTDAVTGVKHTRATTTTYTADGEPEKVEVADLTGGDQTRVTGYTYDEHGRQNSVTDATGATTSFGFDVFGNRMWTVDALGTRIEYAYTARNKLAEVRLRGWHGKPVSGGKNSDSAEDVEAKLLVLEANTYDLAGRLIRHVDAMGRATTYEYTHNDLVFRVHAEKAKKADGTTEKVLLEQNAYDGAGNLVRRLGPGGRLTAHEIDAVGRTRATIDDPGGLARRTEYAYDPNGNVTQVAKVGKNSNTGPFGSGPAEVIDFTYDAAGNQTSESVRHGQSALLTKRRYDQRGLLVAETEPRGNVAGADPAAFTTEYRYDEAEQQVGAKLPAAALESGDGKSVVGRPETVVGFNVFGEETATKDANGNVTKRSYDAVGRPVRVEAPAYRAPGSADPVVAATSVVYDAVGNVIESVGPRGAISRFRYDQLGRQVEQQQPKADAPGEVGGVWKYDYTLTGERLSVTDPTGSRQEATYDFLGRKITQTALERKPVAGAHTTKFDYNDAGDLTKVTSPSGDVTTSAYDALGQRTSVTDPAGVTTQLGYDGIGRQVWQRDAKGLTSFAQYDPAGRKTAMVNLDGGNRIQRRTSFAHDAAGQVVSATDALGKTTKFDYDPLGRLVKQVEPVSDTNSITTSFGYDAQGNRTRYTDGRGNSTFYTFNALSLPETVREPATTAHPAEADRTWTSVYDAAGNATKIVSPGNVSRTREYDALNRLVKETGTGAGVNGERLKSYDDVGRLTGTESGMGKNAYTYNDRGAMLTATGISGESAFEYDADGRPTTRSDASGTSRFSYLKGRLSTVSDGVTGAAQAFGYDAVGRLDKVDYGQGRTREFGYDVLGRQSSDVLKASTGVTASSVSYEYDLNDRLTRKVTAGTAGAGDNGYTYDFANRLASWTTGGKTTEYGWDASGNRIRNGEKTATFDERNRVLADGDYTYSYTARGGMASRTSSGMEEKFSFDSFDRLISVGKSQYTYDDMDRVLSRGSTKFAYAGADLDPVSDGTATYGRGPSGELLSIGQGADKRFTLADKHGDVVGGFDPSEPDSGLADSTAFDPFGTVTASSGSKRAVGYQGDWTDPDTQQVNMGARWYQPGTGAFASRDTVSAASGPSTLFNRYTYGAGRPLDLIDPDGHWPNWGAIGRGIWEGVKEVSGYNDVAKFIKEPSIGNFLWAASNFVPGGKIAKGAIKLGAKFGGDLIGAGRRVGGQVASAGRRYGDDVVGGVRRYADDVAGGVRRYADDVAGGVRRVGGHAAAWAGRSAAKAAAAAAARRAAAAAAAAALRRAQLAVTARAKAAIASAAKRNPLPVQQAVLKPRLAAKDLVSSSPNVPARFAAATAENVQDVNKVWETVKATIIKPGTSVIQSVAEQAVSDFANTQVPGLGDALSLMGGHRKRGSEEAKDAGRSARGQVTCKLDRNSFDGATTVLMADGSRKPIQDVKVGDKVIATDPTTGKTAVKEVTDVRAHRADGKLYEISVDSAGGKGKITATDEHPFWVESLGRWLGAEDLKAGYRFLTADNRPATVTGTRSFSDVRQVYNLTVDGIHTYYVGAGSGQTTAADVLVHNCGPLYSELDNGRAGPAYAEVSPQVLADAAQGLIGSAAGRGKRYSPAGFLGDTARHSRGHLIGKQFGGDGRDLRNLVTQSEIQNSGPISDAEDLIAEHVKLSGNTIIMSVTPEYGGGGVVPSHVVIEAVDDFGWSFRRRLTNM